MHAVRSRWLFDCQLRRGMNTCALCAPVPSHSLARCRCVFACTIFTPWLGCRSDSIALATGGRSNMGMDLEAWLLVSVRLDCERRLCWIPAAACPTSWMGAARRKSHCFSFLFWHCFFGSTWMRRRRPIGVSIRIYFKWTDGFHLRRVCVWRAHVSSRVLHHFFLISRWRVCRRRYLLYFMSSSLPGVFRLLCASFGQPFALLRTLCFVSVVPFLSLFASQVPTHLLRGVSADARYAAIRLFRAFHGDDDPHAFFPCHHGHLSSVVVPCTCRQGLSQEGRARGRRHGHRRCTRHNTSCYSTFHACPGGSPPSLSLSLPLPLTPPLTTCQAFSLDPRAWSLCQTSRWVHRRFSLSTSELRC